MRSDHLSKHLKTHQARRSQAQGQPQNQSQGGGEENALIIAQTELGLEAESSDSKGDIVTVGQIGV